MKKIIISFVISSRQKLIKRFVYVSFRISLISAYYDDTMTM